MALNVADVMTAIETSIRGVGGLYTYAYPPDSAQPPFAFVDMPDTIQYDLTMGRGMDRTTLRLFVGVAGSNQMNPETARAVMDFAAGAGPYSLKAAIESGNLDAAVRVVSCEFATIGLAGGNYAGLILTIDVGA